MSMKKNPLVLVCTAPSLTKQSFKDQCDIKKIMKKYTRSIGGRLHVSDLPVVQSGMYGDFTGVKDYQSALNAVSDAREKFDAFPLALRKRFDFDPAKFLEFVDNPDNYSTLVEWGLAQPKVAGAAATPVTPGPSVSSSKA